MITLFLYSLLLFVTPDSLLVKEAEVYGFHNAVSAAVDGKGFIYILDGETNEIIKFSTDLEEIKRAGKQGWGEGEFDSPFFIDGSSGLDISYRTEIITEFNDLI